MVRNIKNMLAGISAWGPLSSLVRRANREQHLKLRKKTEKAASEVWKSGHFHPPRTSRMQSGKSFNSPKRRITKK